MAVGKGSVRVYIEAGTKRTFAAAFDWPGWARSGRDEVAALSALLAYGPRYARAIRPAGVLGLPHPAISPSFVVIERLKGSATTDYGAPGAMPALDGRPLPKEELRRQLALLRAEAWRTFDAAVGAARGKTLSTGPRGGGRDLASIVLHTLEAEAGLPGASGVEGGARRRIRKRHGPTAVRDCGRTGGLGARRDPRHQASAAAGGGRR